MNKSELVEVAAKEAGITKAAADKALTAIIGAVVKIKAIKPASRADNAGGQCR